MLLRGLGVDDVVLTGVATSLVVLSTPLAATPQLP
jgi:nicotinamidase-related amidase